MDKYFRPGKAHLDKIMFYAPADDTVRLTGLQTGRYNWIQTVPPQRIPELERARDMKASPGKPYFPFYLMLNSSRAPLADKRLRQAIAWAIDRTEIVKLVYYSSHTVTAEPTPDGPWATGVNAHKGGPDFAKAKQLLAEAGMGNGLNLTYMVKSQVPVLVKTGEILREQLKKVGINLEVQPLESGQYFEGLVGKKFDIAGRVVERHRRPRHVLLPDAALVLRVELQRLQVGGGGQAARRVPLHLEPGRAQEDVSRPRQVVPGRGLARRVQQRDPALLDEAERARLGAALVARAPIRGHLDRVIRA
jgi:hypothetical protein